jgi:CDP-glucose 4,6-dehydratase
MLNVFSGKTVLVTGHTGFKGSWLSIWLKMLEAKVVGLALDPNTIPSHFDAALLKEELVDYRVDIRSSKMISEIIHDVKPDFVFHLAAQPLVRESYSNPIDTYAVNVMGTIHILDALRNLNKHCAAVFITSDKCYDNVEWTWGYRENDRLGGPDPYSASKGAAEIAIRSYVKSYFSNNDNKVQIGIGRAGNVIGGGDWALDRIVPDCVKAWSKSEIVQLRNPHATRPWQHVLEPLSGYINLAVELYKGSKLHGEPFNFGPPASQNHTVLELVKEMSLHWEKVKWEDVSEINNGPYESGLLKLNCDKALHFLNWEAVMNFEQTIQMTSEWYKSYYSNEENSILEITKKQIAHYTYLAKQKNIKWATI